MALTEPDEKGSRVSRLIINTSTNPEAGRDLLILVLLDGGLDGLYAVPPHAEAALRSQRPALALPDPGRPGGVIDLDGQFGLHPLLAPLEEIYREKQLAIVHACGSPDQTLSHFEASLTLQTGGSDSDALATGWLARHLACVDADSRTARSVHPLRAVTFSATLPQVFAGSNAAITLPALSDLRLEIPSVWSPNWESVLSQLYSRADHLPGRYGRDALKLLEHVRLLQENEGGTVSGSPFDNSSLGRQLSEIAQLIHLDLGLEIAVVRAGGWDSHQGQVESIEPLLQSLGKSLRGFWQAMGNTMQRITVVVMTEFGRRGAVNLAGGTDHGRGTVMLLIGGGIHGGQVCSRWPGIRTDQLDDNGNLRVTTDSRDVLAEVVSKRLQNAAVSSVFPDFTPSPREMCRQI